MRAVALQTDQRAEVAAQPAVGAAEASQSPAAQGSGAQWNRWICRVDRWIAIPSLAALTTVATKGATEGTAAEAVPMAAT